MAADSPRATLTDFFSLANKGRYAEAAEFLDLVPAQRPQGPELARQLKAVLDRHLWVELETISPLSQGDDNDGQPKGVEQIGFILGEERKEPVRLVRRELAGGARWLFSRNTVSRIDPWYQALADRWIRGSLPQLLLRVGPKRLLWWQWLALPVVLFLGWQAGRLLSWLTRRLASLVPKARTDLGVRLLRNLRLPVALAWGVGVAALLVRYLGLNPPAAEFVSTGLSALLVAAFFGAAFALVEVFDERARYAPWAVSNPSALSALGLASRFAKVTIAAFGVLAVLIEMGYPVTSVLAGLGIGGLGLALAAQKTVENLFGSVSLALDEAIRVGDVVQVENVLGRVEAIGLRSTRIRTADRTVVSFPNGALAALRIESLTARDRVRLYTTLSLGYGTTATQLRQVTEGIEALLRAHPRIWPDDLTVGLRQLGPISLDVDVTAWFVVTPDEFVKLRGPLLLQLMEIVEKAGASLNPPAGAIAVPPKKT